MIYMHMLDGSLQVSKGDAVAIGQKIGKEGNTGASQGSHLHLQVCESIDKDVGVETPNNRKNFNPFLVLYGYNIEYKNASAQDLKTVTKGRFCARR